ncbi:Glycosyltransferase involved in cell wall bisynthesis [Jeotgalicoccus aerolatus]|uniref:Glycosyltransferase involved in cell wall bisynthesis n=1 Tax=Jeotgalicoccus aerolatus TaxID=709510 RepID=A0A1G8VUQ2_9STAP|nr:glycosyltransferase family 4 protein [Jeotgalicoccus aerolatus]SDJ69736.1 Glycosyltransferase involved in cell wall bisynthesis [Jeotgalicoccus aerolatus]
MKILLITQNFYPEIGSGANRLKNLYVQLSKNHEVEVLTTDPSYPNAKMYKEDKYWNNQFVNESKDIMRLNMRMNKQSKSMIFRLLYYFELAYKVRVYVRKYQKLYDAVYVTTPNIFIPWAAFFQKKKTGVKRILEVRDLWPDSVRDVEKMNIDIIFPVLKFMEKMLYKQSDKIVINNEGFRKYINRMIKNKPILFLPNAFSEDEVQFEKAPDNFRVIYTGNIGFAQSYEKLQEMAHKLEENKINFKIIGYGMNAHLFQSYIEYNDFKYVTFEEEKTREECLVEIRNSNVQLSILKDSEVFLNVLPGKVIDGIASGVPVVTNLGGYTSDLVNEYQVGYAKEKATSDELADAIKKIKASKELETEMRTNSKRLSRSHFHWETNIEKLEEFIFDKEFK